MGHNDKRDVLIDGSWRSSRHGGGQEPSRREFLASMAAVGLTTAAITGSSVSQKTASTAKPQLIDVHHHVFPPAFLVAARDAFSTPASRARLVSEWTVQKALAQMDENGVATAIVSITNPGIWFGDIQAARLARNCNEYAAKLVLDYPGRFGFFAAVPLPDTEGSLGEIAYALDVLKADGIGLLTSYGDKWPGDVAYARVFDELNRRKASLLYSGSFARFRDIHFIFAHAGGTIPMLAGRIVQTGGALFGLNKNVPNGVEYELKRLHYEIANSANKAAMAALMTLVPSSQIMFGTDCPLVPTGVTASGMFALGLSAEDLQRIGRDNALALFPRFRA